MPRVRHVTDITAADTEVLDAALVLGVSEADGESYHLVIDGRRHEWLVETSLGQLVVDLSPFDDHARRIVRGDHRVLLRLPDRVRRFAECFAGEAVSLGLADDDRVVLRAGGVTMAIDQVPEPADTWHAPWYVTTDAWVEVPLRQFVLMLSIARTMPTGVEAHGVPMPPMWMHLGGTALTLDVDWGDFVANTATYRVDATGGSGAARTCLPHGLVENFLRHIDPVDADGTERRINIGIGSATDTAGTTRTAVILRRGGWSLTIWAVDALATRWADELEAELADDDELLVTRTGRDTWQVLHDRDWIDLTLHDGRPDTARVSTRVLDGATESLALLRELSALNASVEGVRLWFADGEVRAAVDVPCTTLSAVPLAVRRVSRAAALGPLLAGLATAANTAPNKAPAAKKPSTTRRTRRPRPSEPGPTS